MSRNFKRNDDNFKKQIVELANNGKKVKEIAIEYEISKATVYQWIIDYNKSGSFKAGDNRTDDENELITLRKRNKELEMEVDILKQAALIMGRK